MKRAWFIVVAGVVLATAAYFGSYYAGTADSRGMTRTSEPELAWLKQEFHLDTAEFTRISQMHESFLAGCAERCRLIDEKNEHLKHLLAATNAVTPAIEQTLAEAAQLRAECQKQMLQHFYDVSRTMPSEQGRRYLAWVHEQTIVPDTHRGMHPSPETQMQMHAH